MELANPLQDGEPGSSEQRCNLVDVHLFTQEPHEPCVHLVRPSLVAVDWYHVLTHLNSTNGLLDIKPSGQTQCADGGALGPFNALPLMKVGTGNIDRSSAFNSRLRWTGTAGGPHSRT